MGRLKDGVTMTQARAEMDAVVKRLEEEHPDTNRGVLVDVLNYRYKFPDKWRRQLYFMLLGVVLAVLLVACVNVANLLLARAQSRQREIALRSAIGAGRLRVLRQLLTESLVLASLGGLLGIALGYVGLRAIASAFGAVPPAFLRTGPSMDASSGSRRALRSAPGSCSASHRCWRRCGSIWWEC